MDVIGLHEFYDSNLGKTARRMIMRRLRASWKNLTGQRVIGLGYATPYLDMFQGETYASHAFMPARQGVLHWPLEGGKNKSSLCHMAELPIRDEYADRILVVHGLEMADNLEEMLSEIWRVLKPGGRAVFVVPNRRGLWARFDSTPFGHGRPFSRPQLANFLLRANLSPGSWSGVLYQPPSTRVFHKKYATAWERAGGWFWPAFSGVIMVEVTKQVYGISEGAKAKQLRFGMRDIPVPAGAAPSMKPSHFKSSD